MVITSIPVQQIFIALGANLNGLNNEKPIETLRNACLAIEQNNTISILKRSSVWKSAPVPLDPDMPWYRNAVITINTSLNAHDLLQSLLAIEQDFGRVRSIKNAPRILDLDIIDYNTTIINSPTLTLPHSRMHERAFVLRPMAEITPDWIHPQTHQNINDLIKGLDPSQKIECECSL